MLEYLSLTCLAKQPRRLSTRPTLSAARRFNIAPEVILNRGHNSAADIWSLGVLINEMITGDTPFYKEGMDQLDLYRQICSAKFEAHPILQGKTQAIDIIGKLLSKVPSQRLGQLKNGTEGYL